MSSIKTSESCCSWHVLYLSHLVNVRGVRASTMCRLHTYLRASMSQKRLPSLALLHIHYDRPVDLDLAVSIYAKASSQAAGTGVNCEAH